MVSSNPCNLTGSPMSQRVHAGSEPDEAAGLVGRFAAAVQQQIPGLNAGLSVLTRRLERHRIASAQQNETGLAHATDQARNLAIKSVEMVQTLLPALSPQGQQAMLQDTVRQIGQVIADMPPQAAAARLALAQAAAALPPGHHRLYAVRLLASALPRFQNEAGKQPLLSVLEHSIADFAAGRWPVDEACNPRDSLADLLETPVSYPMHKRMVALAASARAAGLDPDQHIDMLDMLSMGAVSQRRLQLLQDHVQDCLRTATVRDAVELTPIMMKVFDPAQPYVSFLDGRSVAPDTPLMLALVQFRDIYPNSGVRHLAFAHVIAAAIRRDSGSNADPMPFLDAECAIRMLSCELPPGEETLAAATIQNLLRALPKENADRLTDRLGQSYQAIVRPGPDAAVQPEPGLCRLA